MSRHADVTHLVSKLRFNIQPTHRRLKNPEGPLGRAKKIQKTLTAVIKYERIELYYNRGDEARGYVERLISEAIRHGPGHKETMEMADFWILEKQLVHKLFKVLVPRFQNYTSCYTRFYRVPSECPDFNYGRNVLELKGNIYPSLDMTNPHSNYMIHNVLLEAAKREYREEKYRQIADDMRTQELPQ